MNAITGLKAEVSLSSGSAPPPILHTLRRTGRKAVRFTGWQVLQAQGCGEDGTMWYDLAIYRSVADAVIAELVARRQNFDEQDLSRVEVFASLAEAASWLETYPCAADVPIPPGLASCDRPMYSRPSISPIRRVRTRCQAIVRLRKRLRPLLA
jgi:hypothetical protein